MNIFHHKKKKINKINKKKILYYSDCPLFGGSEKILVNLTHSYVINKKYNLYFAYRRHKNYHNDAQREISQNTKKHPLFLLSNYLITNNQKINNIKPKILKSIIKFFNIGFNISHLYIPYDFIYLFKFLRKIKPDILHVNNGGYPGAYTCRLIVFVGYLAGIKNIIFQVNNLAIPIKKKKHKIYDKIIEEIVTVFITCSKAAKNQLNLARNFNANKIINIPNTIHDQDRYDSVRGILRDELKIGKSTIIIGSVGQLIKRKGYQILIESVKILKDQDVFNKDSAFFVIFGEGSYRFYLEKKIKKYKLENLIILPGFKKNILNYVKDFDIFVLPSISFEDFPNAIIEAMLQRKPIIGSNIAGIPEQIDDQINGFVIQPSNPVDLAEALKKLINNEDLRRDFGEKSYLKYITNFSYDLVMKKYLKLYNTILQRN